MIGHTSLLGFAIALAVMVLLAPVIAVTAGAVVGTYYRLRPKSTR